MKIIITEDQNNNLRRYVLRRINQFVEIVEDQITGYENNSSNPWWCSVFNPDTFLDNLRDRSIEVFVDENWSFFHDNTESGGSNMDLSVLYKLVDENYGNYIRNLYVRKCNQSRF